MSATTAPSSTYVQDPTMASSHSTFGWASTLFGTAIGAGILFLPLSAGAYGFWPLLIATVLIGPLTYLSHYAYARIIARSPQPGADLLTALSSYFGQNTGAWLAVAYLVMLFPVLLVYSVSITTTVDSFIVNQLGGPEIPRWILAPILIGLLVAALAFGERIMLAAAELLVVPLLIALGAFSLYLIPQWDLGSFLTVSSEHSFWASMVLILPVLVFSSTFIGSLSQFAVSAQRSHGEFAEARLSRVIMLTTVLLTVFTMFFVWSCALALGADGMAQAAADNLPVLSYFANTTRTPFLALVTPIVAICAIASSFIGVALGAREGLHFLGARLNPSQRELSDAPVYLFIFAVATVVAIVEPSVMDLITVAGGLLITIFQFGVPMLAVYTVARLAPLRRSPGNAVIIAFGAVVLGSTIWGFF